jgi:PEP-CTERM motif
MPIRNYLAPIACLLAGALASGAATAALVSEDSPFGVGTLTFDTATGLRWLDLTESADFSHDQLLQALGPGQTFEGFRLATRDEVAGLFTAAGFDLSAAAIQNFVPQNFDPAVALGGLVGVLGNNGNCGTGCTFSFTAGFTAGPPTIPQTFAEANFAFFDNSQGQDPNDPMAPLGRAILDGGSFGNSDPGQGAWLVLVPEPGTILLFAAGVAGLAAFGRRR